MPIQNIKFEIPPETERRAEAIKAQRDIRSSTLGETRPYRFSEANNLFLVLPKEIAKDSAAERVLGVFREAEKSIQHLKTLRRQLDVKGAQSRKPGARVSAEYALEVAANHAEPLLKARAALAKEKQALAKKKERWVLEKPDPNLEGERQEIRAMLRGMSVEDRHNFIARNGSAKTIMDAVVHAIPEMSGIDPKVHENTKQGFLRSKFGEEMDEVSQVEKAIADTERALELVKSRALTGVNAQAVSGIIEDISTGADSSLRRISTKSNGNLNSFDFDHYYETFQHANPKKLERLKKIIDGDRDEGGAE